ncbi:MAG: CDP-alcohol phosphatidyltransferase family protein [Myxococcota bacterium]|jgi:phosphatidylglycerophosphate synthase|nr:CDP-alcohol phosphatidyltransferase family protein [Myxococcota bacterium]
MSDDAPPELRVLLIRQEREAAADEQAPRVFGLEPIERLRRTAERLGAARCDVLDAGEHPPLDPAPARYFIVRSDLVYDERLIAGLLEAENVVLADRLPNSGAPEALAAHVHADNLDAAVAAVRGLEYQRVGADEAGNALDDPSDRFVTMGDLAPSYDPKLRKFFPPFVLRPRTENVRQIESAIFKASYKGITDLVTKWVWPFPARLVTRFLAKRGVRPNTVTAWSYLFTILATWWFYEGWFAAGLVPAWLMTFLDTVDGKLARCTLTSSRLGDVLDHGLDLVHPPVWWAAWAWGISANFAGIEPATLIVLVGYVTGRLLEGVFLLFFKQEIFTWQRFDALFRTIIARRNPNLILLSVATAFGRPDLGFLAVAAWTVVANVVPAVRIVQAFLLRRTGVEIRSWYEEPATESGGSNAS